MDTLTAVRLWNEETDFRFFTFTVDAETDYFLPGHVIFTARWSNHETSPTVPPGFMITPYRSVSFDVRGDTMETLYRKVMGWLLDIVTHELREGVRNIGSDKAPFHPHREEGQEAWGDQAGDSALALGIPRDKVVV